MFADMDRLERYGPFVLRLGVGLIMIMSGFAKVTGLTGVTKFFGGVGIPLPGLMAPLVAVTELLGGIALLLGIGTRVVGLLFTVIMLVAILTTRVLPAAPFTFNQVRLEYLILMASVSLFFSGAGEYSIDAFMGFQRPVLRR